MSRHETDFRRASDVSVDVTALLGDRFSDLPDLPRQEAIISLLTSNGDWRDAARRLGGAFSVELQQSPLRLTEGKAG